MRELQSFQAPLRKECKGRVYAFVIWSLRYATNKKEICGLQGMFLLGRKKRLVRFSFYVPAGHRETPGEGFPRENLPPEGFHALPALCANEVSRKSCGARSYA